MQGSEIAGAFASLRANDLIWNYVVNNYLKGETPPAFDLLYWNGDSANLPGPMFAYYLRNLYLDNRLREPGALTMAGERIDLRRVSVPDLRARDARRPHRAVAQRLPERRRCSAAGRRSCWAPSGHIAGVINPPATDAAQLSGSTTRRRRRRRVARRRESAPGQLVAALVRLARAPRRRHASRRPRTPGSAAHPPLDAAPGRYVREPAD